MSDADLIARLCACAHLPERRDHAAAAERLLDLTRTLALIAGEAERGLGCAASCTAALESIRALAAAEIAHA